MRTTIWAAAAVTAGVLGLAGCGSDSGSDAASEQGSSAPDGASEASDAALSTADSSLGEIVVDGEGRTAYVFDEDTAGSGESACGGRSLDIWPAITADSNSPTVDGVAGEVGTNRGPAPGHGREPGPPGPSAGGR